MITDLKLEMKGIKSFIGREGYGFNATLYVDEIKTAFIIDEANGGEYMYNVLNKEMFEKFNTYVNSLPKEKSIFDDSMISVSRDSVIARLIDYSEFIKKMKGKMKINILAGEPINNQNSENYSCRIFKLKKPIDSFSTENLQIIINKIKSQLENNEVILNTNLPSSIKI